MTRIILWILYFSAWLWAYQVAFAALPLTSTCVFLGSLFGGSFQLIILDRKERSWLYDYNFFDWEINWPEKWRKRFYWLNHFDPFHSYQFGFVLFFGLGMLALNYETSFGTLGLVAALFAYILVFYQKYNFWMHCALLRTDHWRFPVLLKIERMD